MKMKCMRCKDFEKNMKCLDTCTTSAFIHNTPYEGEYFRYCPWCGMRLIDLDEFVGDSDHEHDDRIL